MAIYNSENDKLASDIQSLYASANINQLAQEESANLDKLLQAELDNVDALYQQKLTTLLLNMADGNQPVNQFRQKNLRRVNEIGMASLPAAQDYLNAKVRINQLTQTTDDFYQQVSSFNRNIPPCSSASKLPEQAPILKVAHNDSAAVKTQLFNLIYANYRNNCETLLQAQESLASMPSPASELMQTYTDLETLNHTIAQQTLLRSQLTKSLKQAKSEYKAALKTYQAIQTNEAGDALEQHRQKLADLVKTLDKAQHKVGHTLMAEAKISAIQDILSAMASQDEIAEAQSRERSPELQLAIDVASASPSIASTLANMHSRTKAESLSELLIEMQHQALLISHNKQRQAIDLQRQALLQQRQQLLQKELVLRMHSLNALCHFSTYQAGLAKPDIQQCHALKVTGQRCQLGEDLQIESCSLAAPWPFAEDNFQRGTDAKRALYNSVAQFSQAHIHQAQLDKNTYQLMDLAHRQSLVDNRHAIQAWDNIIDVPIDQLQAYHEDGIKPDDLSDLIIKAVGLTAIAVSVD
ncbi:hypothetical protein R50073_07820 [Maricurvus nonylphenolicus]|uniref:hypothetical protein n=1 Tax=Maricurvus nonylphenolicus TaxID=1008307 RepID=UPI0036F19BEA